jgi:hypothetical protein
MYRVRAAIGAQGGWDGQDIFGPPLRRQGIATAKHAAAKTKRTVAPAKVKAERKAAQRAPRAEVADKPVAKDPSPGGVLSS